MWRLVLPSSPCLGVWAGLSSFWVCLWPVEVVHSADPNMQGMNIVWAVGAPWLQHPAVPCVCAWHSHMCSECATPL